MADTTGMGQAQNKDPGVARTGRAKAAAKWAGARAKGAWAHVPGTDARARHLASINAAAQAKANEPLVNAIAAVAKTNATDKDADTQAGEEAKRVTGEGGDQVNQFKVALRNAILYGRRRSPDPHAPPGIPIAEVVCQPQFIAAIREKRFPTSTEHSDQKYEAQMADRRRRLAEKLATAPGSDMGDIDSHDLEIIVATLCSHPEAWTNSAEWLPQLPDPTDAPRMVPDPKDATRQIQDPAWQPRRCEPWPGNVQMPQDAFMMFVVDLAMRNAPGSEGEFIGNLLKGLYTRKMLAPTELTRMTDLISGAYVVQHLGSRANAAIERTVSDFRDRVWRILTTPQTEFEPESRMPGLGTTESANLARAETNEARAQAAARCARDVDAAAKAVVAAMAEFRDIVRTLGSDATAISEAGGRVLAAELGYARAVTLELANAIQTLVQRQRRGETDGETVKRITEAMRTNDVAVLDAEPLAQDIRKAMAKAGQDEDVRAAVVALAEIIAVSQITGTPRPQDVAMAQLHTAVLGATTASLNDVEASSLQASSVASEAEISRSRAEASARDAHTEHIRVAAQVARSTASHIDRNTDPEVNRVVGAFRLGLTSARNRQALEAIPASITTLENRELGALLEDARTLKTAIDAHNESETKTKSEFEGRMYALASQIGGAGISDNVKGRLANLCLELAQNPDAVPARIRPEVAEVRRVDAEESAEVARLLTQLQATGTQAPGVLKMGLPARREEIARAHISSAMRFELEQLCDALEAKKYDADALRVRVAALGQQANTEHLSLAGILTQLEQVAAENAGSSPDPRARHDMERKAATLRERLAHVEMPGEVRSSFDTIAGCPRPDVAARLIEELEPYVHPVRKAAELAIAGLNRMEPIDDSGLVPVQWIFARLAWESKEEPADLPGKKESPWARFKQKFAWHATSVSASHKWHKYGKPLAELVILDDWRDATAWRGEEAPDGTRRLQRKISSRTPALDPEVAELFQDDPRYRTNAPLYVPRPISGAFWVAVKGFVGGSMIVGAIASNNTHWYNPLTYPAYLTRANDPAWYNPLSYPAYLTGGKPLTHEGWELVQPWTWTMKNTSDVVRTIKDTYDDAEKLTERGAKYYASAYGLTGKDRLDWVEDQPEVLRFMQAHLVTPLRPQPMHVVKVAPAKGLEADRCGMPVRDFDPSVRQAEEEKKESGSHWYGYLWPGNWFGSKDEKSAAPAGSATPASSAAAPASSAMPANSAAPASSAAPLGSASPASSAAPASVSSAVPAHAAPAADSSASATHEPPVGRWTLPLVGKEFGWEGESLKAGGNNHIVVKFDGWEQYASYQPVEDNGWVPGNRVCVNIQVHYASIPDGRVLNTTPHSADNLVDGVTGDLYTTTDGKRHLTAIGRLYVDKEGHVTAGYFRDPRVLGRMMSGGQLITQDEHHLMDKYRFDKIEDARFVIMQGLDALPPDEFVPPSDAAKTPEKEGAAETPSDAAKTTQTKTDPKESFAALCTEGRAPQFIPKDKRDAFVGLWVSKLGGKNPAMEKIDQPTLDRTLKETVRDGKGQGLVVDSTDAFNRHQMQVRFKRLDLGAEAVRILLENQDIVAILDKYEARRDAPMVNPVLANVLVAEMSRQKAVEPKLDAAKAFDPKVGSRVAWAQSQGYLTSAATTIQSEVGEVLGLQYTENVSGFYEKNPAMRAMVDNLAKAMLGDKGPEGKLMAKVFPNPDAEKAKKGEADQEKATEMVRTGVYLVLSDDRFADWRQRQGVPKLDPTSNAPFDVTKMKLVHSALLGLVKDRAKAK